MKYTLISTVLLMSLGVAHAGGGWDVGQGKPAGNSSQPQFESQSMQSSAVQPGIGDNASQFNNDTQGRFDFNDDDWADLRNEEIYGAF